MSKLREIIQKIGYSITGKYICDKLDMNDFEIRIDQAEKEILETHIPKSQLPIETEIYQIIIDNTFGFAHGIKQAKAITERINNVKKNSPKEKTQ